MPPPPEALEPSLDALRAAAEARHAEGGLPGRLTDVRALLGEELAALELALATACAASPAPADEAARHLLAQGGKRVRPLTVLLSAGCFGGGGAVARELAVVAELVHSATLLHDDVVDEGMVRRGAVTARRLHGNGVSVLAGDLLLVEALERTARVAPAELGGLLATLRRLVNGEVVQLRGRTELDLARATYEAVLADKTASLFAWCAGVGAAVAGASAAQRAALERFGERLGVAFQLVDDVLDYQGEGSGKTLFADLAEGKLTLPLVLAVERRPALSARLARLHAGEREGMEALAAEVRASGACDEVRALARACTEEALAALDAVPACPSRALLLGVARELAARVA